MIFRVYICLKHKLKRWVNIIFKNPIQMEHINWFNKTNQILKSADGKDIEVWEFNHQNDEDLLSEWSNHFRNHYCLDAELDVLRGGLSRAEYLTSIKFPDRTKKPGPSIRAGDFAEILVADYIEFILGFWVPRVRWSSKMIRNESPKGSDVIGFKFHKNYKTASSQDEMFVIESKTKFSKSKTNRLQKAIDDSVKDLIRIDESLNFIKQKAVDKKDKSSVEKVERFQNPVDTPYLKKFGAAEIISDDFFDKNILSQSDCSNHPNSAKLTLLVIKGVSMMDLVHELYQRAANEA